MTETTVGKPRESGATIIWEEEVVAVGKTLIGSSRKDEKDILNLRKCSKLQEDTL